MKNKGYTDRMLHVSADLKLNPDFVVAARMHKLFIGPKLLVDKKAPYNVGNNKAKKLRRKQANERRVRTAD